MDAPRIVVVDDEESIQMLLREALTTWGYRVTCVGTGREALEAMQGQLFDLALVDIRMPEMDGLTFLREIKKRDESIEVVIMTGYPTVATAVEALKEGASDYLPKPLMMDELRHLMTRLMERRFLRSEVNALRSRLGEEVSVNELVGNSPAMQRIKDIIGKVALADSPVLIEGESGTGKELVAQAIHLRSGRPAEAFVVVNSGSIPAELLESNLFGHVKGAFTGAIQTKKGLFEVANGGSIFFDEISTVKPEVQAKLLRVIQEKEFLPLGAVQSLQVDVRIIAATNIDLLELVRRGEFREDLFYRLNVISLNLPPLRDRPEDIPLLVDHFVAKYADENAKEIRGLLPEALVLLLDYPWPGNVRELENVIERAVVLASGPDIGIELLPEPLRRQGLRIVPTAALQEGGFSFYETMERFEKEIIVEGLRRVNGVQRRAAALLGLKATTLNEKIKRLKIDYP
jgi:DNA-binding NtrC family response regulator